MDFLNSCTTNVRVVDGALAIPCLVFTLENARDEFERNSQIYKAAAKLREGNILCTVDKDRLCVLGYKLQEIAASLKQLGYKESVVNESQRKRFLLDAVEGSLSCKLIAEGLLHIASWTWWFAGGSGENGTDTASTVIQLHAKFTENGSLYLSSGVRSSQLAPTETGTEDGEPKACILMPSGKLAKSIYPPLSDEAATSRYASWKSSVLGSMQAEGLPISERDAWSEVEFTQDGDSVRLMWPSRLCFQVADLTDVVSTPGRADWRKWFDSSHANAFRDPLALGEQWYTDATEREVGSNVELGGTAEVEPPIAWDATAELVTSPPFNQRVAEQQAAASGIYPTPPDGLLPGTQGTQQPTSDGTTMPPITESSEAPPEEEMDGLRQSVSSSNAPGAEFHRSDDDLFGDMGEMDFGGNEVGDADFDYFDEPDEDPTSVVDLQNAYVDVDMTGTKDVQGNSDSQNRHKATALVNEGNEIADTGATYDVGESNVRGEKLRVEEDDVEATNSVSLPDLPKSIERSQSDRPLSPFGIRERLLPPPIPASTVKAEGRQPASLGRSSTFGPVTFNEGFEIATKYSTESPMRPKPTLLSQRQEPDIFLPPKQKKPRPQGSATSNVNSPDSDEESESSEEDFSESETSVSDAELPHKLPWESRKRKRALTGEAEMACHGGELDWMNGHTNGECRGIEIGGQEMVAMQQILLRPGRKDEAAQDPNSLLASMREAIQKTRNIDAYMVSPGTEDHLPTVDRLFDQLEDLDLVFIAQIVSEQSLSAIPRLVNDLRIDSTSSIDNAVSSALSTIVDQAIGRIMINSSACDLTKLALPRENARQVPSTSGKGPHAVSRPPQRPDSVQQGPDYCPTPSPYVRMQRYGDTMEMLPPALQFWNTLGLSPANGSKDIRLVSVVPGNLDLVYLVQDFFKDLKLVYEANKLGNWRDVADINADDLEELVIHEEAVVLVQTPESSDDVDITDSLKAYAAACASLGKALARIGHEEADRTIMVCLVNPFSGPRAQQALCACFWMLYKGYRDHVPKTHRTAQRSDIVLRILPCDLVAKADSLVLLEQQQLAQLAMEIYDRCPPSAKGGVNKDVPAALMPYFPAPAVELAMPTPRRIPFQLASEPPGDLLHENSVLHLAYAISHDQQWMCFYWVDGSGGYQTQLSACLRGKSIAELVSEAWERTGDWLRARDVTWRVYVVCTTTTDRSVSACWRTVVGRSARRQPLHVTLLSVDDQPELELNRPPSQSSPIGGEKANSTGQGFLTPVTTPSGTGITVSPDASAAAPPTPAPNDPAPEHEADAHLVDVADDSWALILAPSFSCSSFSSDDDQSSAPPLASGMLFRRGASTNASLEALGVNLHWDIRVRPNGTVDEGPVRQAEFTLREVLRLYRNLGLLARVKGLAGEDGKPVLPLHVVGAVKGAEGLEGMLSG